MVPKSGRRPPSKKGKPTTPVTSAQPEAPDNLLEVLNGASINEEHRTIMSAVIQKVQSAKSGLTEACASLLTGFRVCEKYVKILLHRQLPLMLSLVFGRKSRTEDLKRYTQESNISMSIWECRLCC